jgi:hypothetical protein
MTKNSGPKVIVIAGPTASGKTSLGVELALALGGEIVNADSMQVYRGMDIGTAKPTSEEQKGVAHHLMDVVDPDEEYNAAMYRSMALPIQCGDVSVYGTSHHNGYPVKAEDVFCGRWDRTLYKKFALRTLQMSACRSGTEGITIPGM